MLLLTDNKVEKRIHHDDKLGNLLASKVYIFKNIVCFNHHKGMFPIQK